MAHEAHLVMIFAILAVIAILLFSIFLIQSRFERKPLLNHSEKRLFFQVSKVLSRFQKGYFVYPQVSYGEFLTSRNSTRFFTINARRADMVIVDKNFLPVAIIEFQGRGHWGHSRRSSLASKRGDKLKKMAARSARLPFIEVFPETTAEQLQQLILRSLDS